MEDKILITDKMISDIIDCFCIPNPYDNYYKLNDNISGKKYLQEKGYEIEKSSLEKAKEYPLRLINGENYYCVDVAIKIKLYEEAIKELEEKLEYNGKNKI